MTESPNDYLAHVNKLRDTTIVVAKKLKQSPLSSDFDPFHLQEEALKVGAFFTGIKYFYDIWNDDKYLLLKGVKDKLNRLKTEIDKVEQKRNRVLRKVHGENRENVVRGVEKLKQEWETVNTELQERQE